MLARVTLLLAAFTVLAVAGCGPPKGRTPGIYSLNATKKCLTKAGLQVSVNSPDIDFIAASAPDGALRSSRDGKIFTISFGDTRDDSELIERGYRRSATNAKQRKRLNSLLDLEGNTLVLWDREPTAAEKDFVRACLQ
ncbi:MAG TPA: hypothetical protein VF101_16290 [Gaiellaceae bacterium]